jgi:cadmium resistance protein CadD (predicted permease)
LILVAVGISLGFFLQLVSGEENLWAVGLIPSAVGVALLLSAWIVRPSAEDRRTAAPARHE